MYAKWKNIHMLWHINKRLREHAQITTSHLLSVKGDNREDQNQEVYLIINWGYYSSLDCSWFENTASGIKYF